jgi:hypothetical protein
VRTYLVREKAVKALGAALATFDPDYEPGQPLDPDVELVGQALGLLPYNSLVDPNGASRNETRPTAIWRRPVLVETEDEVPQIALRPGRFS